jgi:hypothetical protein
MRQIACIFILAAACASGAFAQAANVMFQSAGIVTSRAIGGAPITPVTGAPYSATMTNQMLQTLSDGTHITQTMTGSVARDSQGRTRQDAPLPSIGVLSAANAPHLVFIQDPVAQVSYTLDLTNRTAQKMPVPPAGADVPTAAAVAGGKFFIQAGSGASASTAAQVPLPPLPLPPGAGGMVMIQRTVVGDNDSANTTSEDLGSQIMQGITVTGTRTKRTIPKDQIGNDAPITIVTEVWTSPELKMVVYSKRTDPRMGEQTFQLTNISRSEPDPSLFAVPQGFTVTDGPQPIQYRDDLVR